MKISSIERRTERYRIIFTWKILENCVPNCGLSWVTKVTTGRLCLFRAAKGRGSRIKRLRGESFQVVGPKLFNCLPPHIRNLKGCSVETFKNQLDLHLQSIPDLPIVPNGLTPPPMDPITACHSNSIANWTHYLKLDERRSPTETMNNFQCIDNNSDSLLTLSDMTGPVNRQLTLFDPQ